jgi:lysophospholipase L1-like esterase
MALLRFLLLLVCSLAALAESDFFLKDGDRVVFYGDSITDQRLYTTFTESFVVTRFPGRKIEFIHSGWGGDRVTGGSGGPIDVRLQRDVIAYRPTVVTIMLGMNDGRYRAFDEEIFRTYVNGYAQMVDVIQAALPHARLTLIRPSPYDDVTREPGFPGGYNAVLVRYGQYLKELAAKKGAGLADLNTAVVAALEKAKAADPKTAQRIVPDRVHPGPGGHLLMAGELLKAWNAPSIVSAVEIDAAGKRVVRADSTFIDQLETAPAISWIQTDRALPMFIEMKDPVIALAVRSSDFVESLNRQPLKVTGLTAPRYTLKIDGDEAGTFSKDELAAGVNLAMVPTPMARQAAAVHALTLKHNNVHFVRWRQLQLPFENDTAPQKHTAIGALDALELELVNEQRAAAQPKPRRYELLRAGVSP